MRQAKLIELQDELAIACSVASQQDDPETLRTLTFHLNRAQKFLYWKFNWRDLIATFTFQTAAGVTEYDYPTIARVIDGVEVIDQLEPRRITSTTLERSTTRAPMFDGINPILYSTTQSQQPFRYEPRLQLEVFPTPDKAYPVFLQGYVRIRRFKDQDDFCTVDADMVLLVATANLKATWGQDDASSYQQEAASLFKSLNGADHGLQRHIPMAAGTPSSPKSPMDYYPWPLPTPTGGNWVD